jgi:uncharacterized membrane protein
MTKVPAVEPVRSRQWRPLLMVVGILILMPSLLWLAFGMLGLAPTDSVAIGASSGLRTLGSVAVLGCLLAAAGS